MSQRGKSLAFAALRLEFLVVKFVVEVSEYYVVFGFGAAFWASSYLEMMSEMSTGSVEKSFCPDWHAVIRSAKRGIRRVVFFIITFII